MSLNDVEAAETAVNYLLSKGHTRIGTIMKLDDGQGRLRYLGYVQALGAAGLPVSDSRIVWIDTDDFKQLSLCMDKILARVANCTALLCYNDQVAFQLIHLLKERNIRVPEDLSVIGYDNGNLCLATEPELTSVDNKLPAICDHIVTTMMGVLDGKEMPQKTVFTGELIKRASTK